MRDTALVLALLKGSTHKLLTEDVVLIVRTLKLLIISVIKLLTNI